ncbi:MAG: PEP-CTERM sorting domain-containing protein, partial [Gammaproteobacteria bacterium]|nr:PEP-CTERM sorting domain-containing protein [Gammaproteobacteria bacterium]
AVDVFSIISLGQDAEVDPRDPTTFILGALDYELDFYNTSTGVSSDAALSIVWNPGWDPNTYIDDYVARWVPVLGGVYDVVTIEPKAGAPFTYEATEIDAIKAVLLPEPSVIALLGLGFVGLTLTRRR